jgi:hypothetical protein
MLTSINYLLTYLPTYLPTYLLTYLPAHISKQLTPFIRVHEGATASQLFIILLDFNQYTPSAISVSVYKRIHSTRSNPNSCTFTLILSSHLLVNYSSVMCYFTPSHQTLYTFLPCVQYSYVPLISSSLILTF